jgi:uncharacterized protein (TIGR03067 family)
MHRVICGLILGLIVPVLAAAGDGAARREDEPLRGNWKAMSFQHKGQDAPIEEAQQADFTIEADGKLTLAMNSEKRKFSYVTDPDKAPKTIDITFEEGPLHGTKQYGIYKLEGDRLTLCLAAPKSAAEDRPKEFSTADKDYVLFVLQRIDPNK